MSVDLSTFPINRTVLAQSEAEVAETLTSANADGDSVYPFGGGTSLDFGLPALEDGIALGLADINQVVDYPARDMTITVGAGITIDQLSKTLAPERQRLPLDVPQSDCATLGGVIATNHSGPLRYGYGTMRDYVIGIRAIDGRGTPFVAGGRVVKNVAGYDLCKLLTGSLGTLGVIIEVTLRLKPIPPARNLLVCSPRDLDDAEVLLASIVHSQTCPAIVELLAGNLWHHVSGLSDSRYQIVVGFDGTSAEVDWMTDRLAQEWHSHSSSLRLLSAEETSLVTQRLTDFSADPDAALVMKFAGLPSRVTSCIHELESLEEGISIQSHAGNGIVIAKFAEFPNQSLPRLKAAAARASGHAVVLSNPSRTEMTHQSVWGSASVPFDMMKNVKLALDPNNVLNPGRFVY